MHGEGKVWLVSFGHLVKGSNVRGKKQTKNVILTGFFRRKDGTPRD